MLSVKFCPFFAKTLPFPIFRHTLCMVPNGNFWTPICVFSNSSHPRYWVSSFDHVLQNSPLPLFSDIIYVWPPMNIFLDSDICIFKAPHLPFIGYPVLSTFHKSPPPPYSWIFFMYSPLSTLTVYMFLRTCCNGYYAWPWYTQWDWLYENR